MNSQDTREAEIVGSLVINEFLAAPTDGAPEFVEVLNVGPGPVDTETVQLSDSRRSPGSIVGTGLIEAGAFAVLTSDQEAFRLLFGDVPTYEVRPWPSLNNSGDEIRLIQLAVVSDSVSYTSSTILKGVSTERINPRAPTGFTGNWTPSLSADGATPGAQNSVFIEDGTPPSILSAEYVSADSILVSFSEPINPESIQSGSIELATGRSFHHELPAPFIDLWILPTSHTEHIDFEGLTDYSGNQIEASTVDIAVLPSPRDVIITEIMSSPATNPGGTPLSEFIELHNVSGQRISLSSLSVNIGPSVLPELVVPLKRRGRVLGPGEFAIIFSEPNSIWINNPSLGSSLDAYTRIVEEQSSHLYPVQSSSLGLNNSQDRVTLTSRDGKDIDSVIYSDSWTDPQFSSGKGRSFERISLDSWNAEEISWATNDSREGSSVGTWFPNTHTESQLPLAGDLVVNEIMYEPVEDDSDGSPDQTEYIELLNVSNRAIALNGLYLIRNNLDRTVRDSVRMVFRNERLEPGDTALYYYLPRYVEDGRHHAARFIENGFDVAFPHDAVLVPTRKSMGLSNDGASLSIRTFSGATLDSVSYSPSWHHFLIAEGRGSSLERIDPASPSNMAGNWTTSTALQGGTPGQPNSVSIFPNPVNPDRFVSVYPKTFSPDSDGYRDVVRIDVNAPAFSGAVRFMVFDMAGREIARPVPGDPFFESATYFWDGQGAVGHRVQPGIYILVIELLDDANKMGRLEKKPVAVLF